nr:hypothetical protein GCM10020092_029290 [Actinoplanes digitatis]
MSILNTGIGWHEARVPTIVTSVPPAAFSWVTGKLRKEVSIPVVASNRINRPEAAEQVLAAGDADLVSMARPLLADPEWVAKTAQSREREIITCIACNQACLDHTFRNQRATCLLNPRSGYETELNLLPTRTVKRVAVVGAGPAGLAAAIELAGRGHRVELFEAEDTIGGQFRLAARIPGKEEFARTLDYYRHMIDVRGVTLHLSTRATVAELAGFDEVVVATGVRPHVPDIPGADHPKVLTYQQLIGGDATAGDRVAIIGASGIGFDAAEFLIHEPNEPLEDWMRRWGVTDPQTAPGGLTTKVKSPPRREVHLLQRKETALGKGLGKTTGWVHRATLQDAGVTMLRAVEYLGVDDEGLHISVPADPRDPKSPRERRVLDVDTVVLCAEPRPPCATWSPRSRSAACGCTSSAAPTSPPSSTPSALSNRRPSSPPASDLGNRTMTKPVTKYVSTRVENGIAQVRLDRPDKLNALTLDTLDDLIRTARWLRRDRTLRAVVIAGEGPSFTA